MATDGSIVWTVIVVLASVCSFTPSRLTDTWKRLSFLFGIVLWLCAAYIWAVLFADTGYFPVVWVHLVPVLLLAGWNLADLMGSSGKTGKYD